MNHFTEKTLEDLIFQNHSTIHQKGFEIMLNNIKRQYRLPSGKIVDLVTFESDGDELMLYVIELKKGEVSADTVSQAFGYYNELMFYLSETYKTIHHKIILVGYEVMEIPLLDFLKGNIDIYKYNYDINGLSFELVSSTIQLPDIYRINKGSQFMPKVPLTLIDQIEVSKN